MGIHAVRLFLATLMVVFSFPVFADPVGDIIDNIQALHRVRFVDMEAQLSRDRESSLLNSNVTNTLIVNGRRFYAILDEDPPNSLSCALSVDCTKCTEDFCPVTFDGEYQIEFTSWNSEVSVIYKIWNVRRR